MFEDFSTLLYRKTKLICAGVKRALYDNRPNQLEKMERLLQRFLDFCKDNQIPVIAAAGNKPVTEDVKDNLPHSLSKPDDSMIIVGAVDQAGQIIPEMVSDRDHLVQVYSPGANIETPTGTSSGTSQAAAIVVCMLTSLGSVSNNVFQSGLVAYYNGLPNLQIYEAAPPGGIWGAKGMLSSHAWPRSSPESPVKVVYNLARGDPAHAELSCVQRRHKFGKRQDVGVCSLSTTLATPTM